MIITIEEGKIYYVAEGIGDTILFGIKENFLLYDSNRSLWVFMKGNKLPISEELDGTTKSIKQDSIISLFKVGIKHH